MRLKGSKDVNVVKARLRLMDGGGINLKLLALIILTSFGVAGAIGATIACYPQRPEYCTRCHSMRPAYDKWAGTVCRDVNCVECHTGGRGVVCLSREIEDSNCTKGGCHTQEKLFAKKEPYKKTSPFSHETHLKEDPPGLKMRCTACHSYQGGMKHFDIDEKTCNLCHFVLRKEVVRLVDGGVQEPGRCALCHKDVEKKIQIYDKEFDHAAYERLVLSKAEGKAGVECMDCHYNETIHGLGDVERRQCYHCHDKVPDDYSSAKEMHYDHMVRHKVGCSPCHREIIHKIYKEDKELEGCESCRGTLQRAPTDSGLAYPARGEGPNASHSLVGSVQRQMTRGEGGRGVNGSPDPMFLATVSCTGCHKSSSDKRGDTDMPALYQNGAGPALNRPFAPLKGRSGSGPTPGPYEGVNPMVCNNCHEKDFEKICKEQKDVVTSRMEVLEKLLKVAGETGRAEAVETMEARHNYEFISSDGSFGVHNIKYTKELLELSIRQLGESMGRE